MKKKSAGAAGAPIQSPNVDALFASSPWEGLTFDDITLVTRYADFLPHETSLKTRFSRNIELNIPFVSAAMDTVTEARMAITLAQLGGIGVIHKNLSIEAQAAEVGKVKHHCNGLIINPVVFKDTDTIEQILRYKQEKSLPFSGFPVVNSQGLLVGILTAKDIKFCTNRRQAVAKVMTSALVSAKKGTSLEDANKIMIKNKIGKLPLVDSQGRLAGLYSFHDVRALMSGTSQTENFDSSYQLRTAAAMSPGDYDRAAALVAAGADALVVDTAHGHTKGVIDTVRQLKKKFPGVDIVAGNVGSADGARALAEAGADGIKVGIGPGSICTTRVVCGVGVPQLSAIHAATRAVSSDIPVIADGGIKQAGDVPKAIAAGASCVMMGGILAATEESPGEKIMSQGRRYVVYRGMGSLEAMKAGKGARERYGQGDVEDDEQLVPQGVEGSVPYRGRAVQVLHQFAGSLRSSLGYNGCRTLPELQRQAVMLRVTSAGLREAHPHDIQMIKDAPNYRND